MGNFNEKPQESIAEDEIPRKARIAKRQIEVYYRDFFMRYRERTREMVAIDLRAQRGEFDESTRKRLRHEQFLRELEYIRRRRNPMTTADYNIVKKIGQGSYGEVFLVRHRKSRELFAMKKLHKRDMLVRRQVNHVWLERFVLASVGQHPHVVKMYYSFQDRDYLYFIMEYLPGGDLLNMLIRCAVLPENWARFYIAEIIVAIDALHRTGIIHRDIKPDNVLFSSTGHVCLSDFGLSKSLLGDLQSSPTGPANAPSFIEHVRRGELNLSFEERMAAWKAVARDHIFSAVGTPSYIAPEVLSDTSYSEACDWWSVGAILYEMLIGVPPFLSDCPQNTIEMIRRWREYLEFPDWPPSRFSPEARDLISRLLCEPSRRLGARRGLEEFKEHPFFEGVDWDHLSEMKAPFIPCLKSDSDTRYFDDEFPGPSPDSRAAKIETPSLSSAGATNTSESTPGSSQATDGAGMMPPAAESQTNTAAPSNAPTRTGKKPRSTRSVQSHRNDDIEFIGFTYVPVHQGRDTRSNWQHDLYIPPTPSSAPPRASSLTAPPSLLRTRIAAADSKDGRAIPTVPKSKSMSSSPVSGIAVPIPHRPSNGSRGTLSRMNNSTIAHCFSNEAVATEVDKESCELGYSPWDRADDSRDPSLNEQRNDEFSRLDLVDDGGDERDPQTSHVRGESHHAQMLSSLIITEDTTAAGMKRKQAASKDSRRSGDNLTVPSERNESLPDKRPESVLSTPEAFAPSPGSRNLRKSPDCDRFTDSSKTPSRCETFGKGIVSEKSKAEVQVDETITSPCLSPEGGEISSMFRPRRTGSSSLHELLTPDINSEVGSTMTPEHQPLLEPEEESLPSLPLRRKDQFGNDRRHSSRSLVRSRNSMVTSWCRSDENENANDSRADDPTCGPLDAATLEKHRIPVPSVTEVDDFVSDAVVELQGAAAELVVAQSGNLNDIQTVVRAAASELKGTARELHENLSSSDAKT